MEQKKVEKNYKILEILIIMKIKNLEIKHTGALHQYCSGPTTTNTCLSLARHPW